jgi:S1-C subfamily serine protease
LLVKRAAVLLLCIVGLPWMSAARAAGPFGTIHIGKWEGGAFTDDKTGTFSHCAASTGYGSGTSVIVGQNAQRVWLLGFANPAWRLTPGETFTIEVTFDGQQQFHLFTTAISNALVTALLPNNSAINELRKAHLMVATIKYQTLPFNLDSTGPLLPIIANCVAKISSEGLAGAGDFSKLPPKPPVTPAAATPPTQPSKETRLVEGNGTGFVISTSGHVVTNNHVINRCVGDIHGNLGGQPPEVLRVVSTDEENDLALLQVPRTFGEAAIVRSTAIHSGDPIIVIGYPFHGLLSSDFTVTTGIVNSLSGVLNDTRYLQISAPVQPGNSGGPLLDNSGHVVGIVAEKLNAIKFAKVTGDLPENINFAIKTGAVRDFLDNSVVSYRTAEPGSELKTAEIAENARKYTMLISCSVDASASTKK